MNKPPEPTGSDPNDRGPARRSRGRKSPPLEVHRLVDAHCARFVDEALKAHRAKAQNTQLFADPEQGSVSGKRAWTKLFVHGFFDVLTEHPVRYALATCYSYAAAFYHLHIVPNATTLGATATGTATLGLLFFTMKKR